MAEPSLDYPGVLVERCGNFVSGSLKLRQDTMTFKQTGSSVSEKVLDTADLKSANWLKRCKGYCLKVTFDGPSTKHREESLLFDGLHEREETKLRNFFSHNYHVQLQTKEQSLKGWNWGDVQFRPDTLSFQLDSKINFEVPLRYVTACNTNKNEAALELQQEHDDQVSLMEIRFFVPPGSAGLTSTNSPTKHQLGDDIAQLSVNDSVISTKEPSGQNGLASVGRKNEIHMNDEERDECGDFDRLEQFKQNVMQGASVVTASDSDVIAVLSTVNCLVPRGRYDMRLYSTFVDLHGKSYDYKIPYGHIIRAFLLPHQDNRQMFFVISVDPPLKQGQTRYPFVILQFNTNPESVEDDEEIELSLSNEQLAERYGKDRLSQKIVGSRYDVVCKLFRVLADRKIIVPGSYNSKSGARCVHCSFKASSGLLYPLERGLIFIHKPPIFLRFEDIHEIDVGSGGHDFLATTASKNLKTFDMEIVMRSGGSRYVFSSVDRSERLFLAQFLRQKGLRVKVPDDEAVVGVLDDRRSSATGAAGCETTAHDAYLNRVRIEGEERVAAGVEESLSSDDCQTRDKDGDFEMNSDDENDADFVGGDVNSSDDDKSSSSIVSSSDDEGKQVEGSIKVKHEDVSMEYGDESSLDNTTMRTNDDSTGKGMHRKRKSHGPHSPGSKQRKSSSGVVKRRNEK